MGGETYFEGTLDIEPALPSGLVAAINEPDPLGSLWTASNDGSELICRGWEKGSVMLGELDRMLDRIDGHRVGGTIAVSGEDPDYACELRVDDNTVAVPDNW